MSAPLSRDNYPGLDPAEAGSMPAEGYGQLHGVSCPAVEAGAAVVLASAVTASAGQVSLIEATGLPEPPFTLQAGAEQMGVTGVNGKTLTVTRGVNGTGAAAHPMGRTMFEVRTSYVYLVAAHPVSSVDAVYVEGSRLLEGYTAHTGQPGNELAGFEGRAVVEMAASPYVTRQYNLGRTEAALKAEGVGSEAAALSFSAPDLVDGLAGTFVMLGGSGGRPTAWAAFGSPGGLCLWQSYSVSVENTLPDDARLRVGVRSGGRVLVSAEHLLGASEKRTISLWRPAPLAGDEYEEVFASALGLAPGAGGLRVYSIAKTVYIDNSIMPEPLLSVTLPPSGGLSGRGWRELYARGNPVRRASYPTGPGGSIQHALHTVRLTESTGIDEARVRIASGSDYKELPIKPGATETLCLRTEGGQWEDGTAMVALCGRVSIESVEKSVAYYPESEGSLREPAESCASRVVVGQRVSVDAGYGVDTDGSYGGMGTILTRPDHVMRHFLAEHMGFGAADIDMTSFDEAGGLYASAITGGYRLGFLIAHEHEFSHVLREMARQARSVIHFSQGKWRLRFLPDSAPVAVKTISAEELAPAVSVSTAGVDAGFVFRGKPLYELANSLTARFGPGLSGVGGWTGTVSAEDAASMAKYGQHGAVMELEMIRDKATAGSVLTHMLMQSSTPLMSVRFCVFYEHFDLSVGDTIEIDSPLYGGRRFFIERMERLDQARAEIEALQWWA